LKRFILLLILLVALPVAAFSLQQGSVFPALPGTTLEGKLFNLGQLEPHPILLTIGTTWCPSCRRVRGEIDKIRPFLAEQGIKYVEVFLNESETKVRKHLSESTYQPPDMVLLDKRIISRALNVRMIPRVILIDKNFNVYRDSPPISSTSLQREILRMVEKK